MSGNGAFENTPPLSAVGTKRTSHDCGGKSAFGVKADIDYRRGEAEVN